MDIDETLGGSHESNHPETASRVDHVTNTLPEIAPETLVPHGTDEDVPGGVSHDTRVIPSAPGINSLPDYGIEEEMIQAAIEASKREAEVGRPDNVVSFCACKIGSGTLVGGEFAQAPETLFCLKVLLFVINS